VFWVISIYYNIRNTLPKSGTFLLGHPVYTLQLRIIDLTQRVWHALRSGHRDLGLNLITNLQLMLTWGMCEMLLHSLKRLIGLIFKHKASFPLTFLRPTYISIIYACNYSIFVHRAVKFFSSKFKLRKTTFPADTRFLSNTNGSPRRGQRVLPYVTYKTVVFRGYRFLRGLTSTHSKWV